MSSMENRFAGKLYDKSRKTVSPKEEINKIYFLELIKQYQNARGIPFDAKSKKSLEDFRKWVSSVIINGGIYINLLEKDAISTDVNHVAEVEKGCYDSLAASNYETSVITPYAECMFKTPYGKLFNARLGVIDGRAVLLDKDSRLPKGYPDGINVYMVQNPYNYADLDKFASLHNNCVGDGVIIGVYGHNDDRDMEEKIETVRTFSHNNLLYFPYTEGYTKLNEQYFYYVATNQGAKKLILRSHGLMDFGSVEEHNHVSK